MMAARTVAGPERVEQRAWLSMRSPQDPFSAADSSAVFGARVSLDPLAAWPRKPLCCGSGRAAYQSSMPAHPAGAGPRSDRDHPRGPRRPCPGSTVSGTAMLPAAREADEAVVEWNSGVTANCMRTGGSTAACGRQARRPIRRDKLP